MDRVDDRSIPAGCSTRMTRNSQNLHGPPNKGSPTPTAGLRGDDLPNLHGAVPECTAPLGGWRWMGPNLDLPVYIVHLFLGD